VTAQKSDRVGVYSGGKLGDGQQRWTRLGVKRSSRRLGELQQKEEGNVDRNLVKIKPGKPALCWGGPPISFYSWIIRGSKQAQKGERFCKPEVRAQLHFIFSQKKKKKSWVKSFGKDSKQR